jgi:hypothetical protein
MEKPRIKVTIFTDDISYSKPEWVYHVVYTPPMSYKHENLIFIKPPKEKPSVFKSICNLFKRRG